MLSIKRLVLLFFVSLIFIFSSPPVQGQSDTLATLFRNSYSVFEILRNNQGIYRDSKVFSGNDFHPSSVASIGMGIIAECIAQEMGWIDDGASRVTTTLKAVLGQNPPFFPDRNASGFFRHWVDMNNGQRAWSSEYSTIDSGILVSGALFAKRYFCDNSEIGNLADALWNSIDWSKSIENPGTGGIYLEMEANGIGKAGSVTKPFNEYIIVAWLAMNLEKEEGISGPATELWNNHYANPDNLPKKSYQGIQLLTDSPGHFLSSFVPQFPYYLCHYFTTSEDYLKFLENARRADLAWWENQPFGTVHQWGLGAGSADSGSGYHASAINNNSSRIYSPHIIAGFLPIAPGDTFHLINLYKNRESIYLLPFGGNNQILWRKSINNPGWNANEVQGVDYSTMLFGMATLSRFLGTDFFTFHNDFFGAPCNQVTSVENRDIQQPVFSVFPNPAQSETQLEFDNLTNGPLLIELFDYQGRLTYTSTHEKQGTSFRLMLPLGDTESGIYFIKVTQNQRSQIQKFLVVE